MTASPASRPSGGGDDQPRSMERVFRQEHGRVVAALVRRFGDIDIAEDATQEAYVEALRTWPTSGLPPNPGAWLTTTARNRAIDRLRRESNRDARHAQAALLSDASWSGGEPVEGGAPDPGSLSSVPDERLRLIFTCCHPALSREAQVALTLRLLGGLTTAEIARSFLVDRAHGEAGEATMAKRLTRSKQKIKAAKIPYRTPPDHELPSRLAGVLATLYLVFNEGYLASTPDLAVRPDLCVEAIRQARVLRQLMPDEPEVLGLLALLLLTEARRPARFADGALVTLPKQDRSLWNPGLISEGLDLVRACLRRGRPGPYQIQAAINAVHTDAARAEDTDWRQVVTLYDQLYALTPTPVVALNRAVAVAEVDGPDAGLAAIDGLPLEDYHAYQASRADLLRRAGRRTEALEAYEVAIQLTTNPAERAFLIGRLAEVLND